MHSGVSVDCTRQNTYFCIQYDLNSLLCNYVTMQSIVSTFKNSSLTSNQHELTAIKHECHLGFWFVWENVKCQRQCAICNVSKQVNHSKSALHLTVLHLSILIEESDLDHNPCLLWDEKLERNLDLISTLISNQIWWWWKMWNSSLTQFPADTHVVICVCTSVIDGAVQIFQRVHSLEDGSTLKHSHIPSNVDSDPPLSLSLCVSVCVCLCASMCVCVHECMCVHALIHDG